MTAKIYPLNEEKLDFLDYDDYGLDESQLIIFKEELKKVCTDDFYINYLVTQRSTDDYTMKLQAIYHALRKGNIKTAKLLQEKNSILLDTLIFYASETQQPEDMENLVRFGCNINATHKDIHQIARGSCLMQACKYSRSDMAQKIIDLGADVNYEEYTKTGYMKSDMGHFGNALSFAVASNSIQTVQVILNQELKNKSDNLDYSFRIACSSNKTTVEMLQLLLSNGVDLYRRVNFKLPFAYCNLDMREFNKIEEKVNFLLSFDIEGIFLQEGLVTAAEYSNIEAMEYMLSKGAKLDDLFLDSEGELRSLLSIAGEFYIYIQKPDGIEYLLKKGLNFDDKMLKYMIEDQQNEIVEKYFLNISSREQLLNLKSYINTLNTNLTKNEKTEKAIDKILFHLNLENSLELKENHKNSKI